MGVLFHVAKSGLQALLPEYGTCSIIRPLLLTPRYKVIEEAHLRGGEAGAWSRQG
jgi:hypothetical protein